MKLLEKIKMLDKKKIFCIVGICLAIIILILVILLFFICNATKEYNNAAKVYNDLSKEYDEALKNTCVDNIVGMPVSFGTIKTEDEGFVSCVKVLFGKNSVAKIRKDVETINEYCDDIETMLIVIEQITNPSASWVKTQLEEIDLISGAELVTEEKNPDGLLNKEGGYVGCVYFSLSEIEQETVPGDSIVEKGTDCGGAVEVYATLEEANARCEYLAGFDGTILYSGSYAIVGTTVIRTSYILSNERQWEITNAITKKLTEIK